MSLIIQNIITGRLFSEYVWNYLFHSYCEDTTRMFSDSLIVFLTLDSLTKLISTLARQNKLILRTGTQVWAHCSRSSNKAAFWKNGVIAFDSAGKAYCVCLQRARDASSHSSLNFFSSRSSSGTIAQAN